ncbi:MAG: DNA polymerase III subunit gamma and tau [Herbiconiux sp.]|uniref:DNA polymerase III subunit gamma and tau n=1 Tax=Herbiconiux sp. TaxID=1871186 RepID=UPI001228D4EF|nr:DNA polymerase III subunit gamma and tau [Herbiconiux sp.]TAJ50283.1 MAG: DNA polymerase III subunit gamma and tau [Herbiconiux sp.]
MVTALYRRYRPENFAEMIGQSQVTDPLMTALRTNRVNHAYLFSGPRGCGKTTSARILARCLNCAEGPTDTPCGVCPSCVELSRDGMGSLDVVEIDAASHGGVDDARDLRERAIFAPARDRFKIFIIDEAHMVTSGGFNALLKIVEEPPEHIKFIFATTEPDKVIGTIRSRTHHYPFRLIPPAQLLEYVQQLCDSEGVEVAPGVLPLVVRAGGGSARDTLSLLDQLIAGSENNRVEYERAVALLGYTHGALLSEAIDALGTHDGAAAFDAVDRVIQTGQDPRRFVEDLLERLRDIIVVEATREQASSVLRGVPVDEIEVMRRQAGLFGHAELSRVADIVNTALTEMTGATSPRLHLELMVARALVPASDDTQRGALARVERLERRIGVDGLDAAPAAAPVASRPVDRAPASAPAPGALPPAPTPIPAASSMADAPARTPSPSSAAPVPVPAAGSMGDAPGRGASAPTPASTPVPAAGSMRDAPVRAAASSAGASGVPGASGASPTSGASAGAGAGADAAAASAAASVPETPVGSAPGVGRSATGDAAARPAATPVSSDPAGPAAAADSRAAAVVPPQVGESGPEMVAVPASVTPVAAPAPTAGSVAASVAASAGAVSLQQLKDAWPEILEAVQKAKMTAWLVVFTAHVRALDGDVLTLAFPSENDVASFKERSAPGEGVSEYLRQAILDVLGIRVKYIARVDSSLRPHDEAVTRAPATPAPAAAAPTAAAPVAAPETATAATAPRSAERPAPVGSAPVASGSAVAGPESGARPAAGPESAGADASESDDTDFDDSGSDGSGSDDIDSADSDEEPPVEEDLPPEPRAVVDPSGWAVPGLTENTPAPDAPVVAGAAEAGESPEVARMRDQLASLTKNASSAPAQRQTPASSQAPAQRQAPASSQAPAQRQAPASSQAPAQRQAPASSQAPAQRPASGGRPPQAPAAAPTTSWDVVAIPTSSDDDEPPAFDEPMPSDEPDLPPSLADILPSEAPVAPPQPSRGAGATPSQQPPSPRASGSPDPAVRPGALRFEASGADTAPPAATQPPAAPPPAAPPPAAQPPAAPAAPTSVGGRLRYGEAVVREILGANFIEEQPLPGRDA